MRQEYRQPRPRRGFIHTEALFVYAVFSAIAAVLIPIFERLGCRWTAIPLAIISLILGVFVSLEEASNHGWIGGVLIGALVLALTALGVYVLVF